MTDSLKIKEKVKERYGKIAVTGDSCCGPSVSAEIGGGGCCSGNGNAVLQASQSATQVSELDCVINLTTDKVKTFREIHRILKPNGIGRMVISDLVTDRQIAENTSLVDPEKWCDCIDGALTKDNYIASIKKGGFENVEVLDEKIYTEGDHVDNRRISSLVIKAVKE